MVAHDHHLDPGVGQQRGTALALFLEGEPAKAVIDDMRLKKVAVFWSIGGRRLSARQASTVAWIEWTCITQRACGTRRWIAPCSPQAVGSGASGRSSVPGRWRRAATGSEARMRAKWRWLGLIRKRAVVADRKAEMVRDRLVHAKPRRPSEGGGQIGPFGLKRGIEGLR
jgi:hypothetical protein